MSTLNDLELADGGWKNYPDLITDSLWMLGARARGGARSGSYHGNWVPQIPDQMMRRFTRAGDIVLDLFSGSATTAIEARRLGRHCIGVDLAYTPGCPLLEDVDTRLKASDNPHDVRTCLVKGDSAGLETREMLQGLILERFGRENVDHIFLHPPYWDMIKFSDSNADLSNAATIEDFVHLMALVVENAWHILKPAGLLTLVIGDKYSGGTYWPIAMDTAQMIRQAGWELRAHNIKDIQGNEKGKGKNANLWRFRALKTGLYIFNHEHVMLFRRPAELKSAPHPDVPGQLLLTGER